MGLGFRKLLGKELHALGGQGGSGLALVSSTKSLVPRQQGTIKIKIIE
jgi:hypothetical protein